VLIVGASFIGLYNVIRTIRGEQALANAYLEKCSRENRNEDDAGRTGPRGADHFRPVLFMFVILPWITISEQGSDTFRPRTGLEEEGRSIYVNNGCTYCHTQFIRNFDWDIGSKG